MRFLDLTLPTAAANLALDEALLEEAESGAEQGEVLRLWESPQLAVVVGRSSRIAAEVHLEVCHAREVPVLRRCSGGAAVVIGPGCLMYSVILSYQRRPPLRQIEAAHQFILDRVAEAVSKSVPDARRSGISDLAANSRKFSGNSLRCKREHLLYHGTLLYEFPLESIAELLQMPPRRPDYRRDRSHLDFLVNLEVPVDALRSAICDSWNVGSADHSWPQARTERLLTERYDRQEWHHSL